MLEKDQKLTDTEIDQFFAELEAQADHAEVARLAQQVLDRHQMREPTLEEVSTHLINSAAVSYSNLISEINTSYSDIRFEMF